MELRHCNKLNSSTANRGAKPRSAIHIQYRPADYAQIDGSTGHFGHGMHVRSENPYIARMMAGTFKLPGKIEDPLQRDG